MGWMQQLYNTYNNVSKEGLDTLIPPLYPIAHTTQNAEIEVWITAEGEFIKSIVITEKELRKTCIPCTESSGSRSGKNPAPHPLFDKLPYLAGDYGKYGGEKGNLLHQNYMEQLEDWCNSAEANHYVKSIYAYLLKGCLIRDLVKDHTIYLEEASGNMLEKWKKEKGDKQEIPPIFSAVNGRQSDAFVRFRVRNEAGDLEEVWNNTLVQEDYIRYYQNKLRGKDLCYITGTQQYCTRNHPSKIRNTGDKAKLISSNDASGFTYLGRFLEAEQAAQVGYEVSQKAHNALKWLVEKQGRLFGDKVFLLWETRGYTVPDITGDTDEFLSYLEEQELAAWSYTGELLAKRLNSAIAGYQMKIKNGSLAGSKWSLLVLDSATTGRMSLTFYREYQDNSTVILMDQIRKWHEEGAWRHTYKKKDGKYSEFYGMPSLKDITLAAYGVERGSFLDVNTKLAAQVSERLLACIVEGVNLPLDIVRSACRRAMSPQNYKEPFLWKKVVTVTCSLVRKYEKERKGVSWNMALHYDSDNLAYNCGRLLAVADAIEKRAQYYAGEKGRQTNAMRYFSKFAAVPCETWILIGTKLIPYQNRLGAKGNDLYKVRQEISSLIPEDDFKKARNLDGCMMLGYDAQCNELYLKKKEENEIE